jgi:tetratricopeptide (TPR) repeat protein
LGIVLVWKQRGADAIVQFEALIKLARRHGLNARLPIGWHDLGEAFRISGQLTEARDAYANALHTATQMQLLSSVQLIHPKVIICDLLEGRFEGVEDKIEGFIPEALAAGLALAEPFGRMLLAWMHALKGELDDAMRAYDAVSDMRDMAVDPQFPLIMEQIGAAFAAGSDTDPALTEHARKALALAAEFWKRYGQAERSARCLSELAALPEGSSL